MRIHNISNKPQKLLEYSSINSVIGSYPNTKNIIKILHKDENIQNDVEVKKIEEISSEEWEKLRSYSGTLLIFLAERGIACLIAKPYQPEKLIISDIHGNTIYKPKFPRWADPKKFEEFITNELGDISARYWCLIKYKKKNIYDKKSIQTVKEDLLKRLKPLWLHLVKQAHADLRGHILNQIKHNSFRKTANLLSRLEELNKIEKSLEDGLSADKLYRLPHLQLVINNAIVMAAHYLHPDATSSITNDDGFIFGDPISENMVLEDLLKNDWKTLSVVLGFIKHELLHFPVSDL